MLNTHNHDSHCSKCESSLKKILLNHAAFCPQCFCQFSSQVRAISHAIGSTPLNPQKVHDAIKNENYEFLSELYSTQETQEQDHPFLFTRLEFHRNLKSHKFLNSENSKHHKAITLDLINFQKELNSSNADHPQFIYIDENHYITTLQKHHINYGLIDTGNCTKKLERFCKQEQHQEKNIHFAFQDDFGYLGPDLDQLGNAFTFQCAISLPHLYFDKQIPKIKKACLDLGFSLTPLQVNKTHPLIYMIQNTSSNFKNPNQSIKDIIELGLTIKSSEQQAQLNSLQSNNTTCYKHFSSSYWSLGSYPSINQKEYQESLEDIICAQEFNYLDTKHPKKIKDQFNTQVKYLLNIETAPDNSSGTEIYIDTFEELLNNIRS
jgi:protein-arginine kinase